MQSGVNFLFSYFEENIENIHAKYFTCVKCTAKCTVKCTAKCTAKFNVKCTVKCTVKFTAKCTVKCTMVNVSTGFLSIFAM